MIVLAAFFTIFFIVSCKEHEHPAEHPESATRAGLTKDELADAIEVYVKKESTVQDGYFLAFDEKADEQLKLTLDKVHRKRLSKVGEDLYFACADFMTPEGKVYDLDVFMRGTNKDNLSFSEFTIHKEAGKERYTWYEEGGVWKTKSLKTAEEKAAEHPKEEEHPKEGEQPEEEHPKEEEHPAEHPGEHPR